MFMVKQFTALILILALANPFCCCFAETLNTSEKQDTQPVLSCCHNPEFESNSDTGDEEPACPNGCPCKKPSEIKAYGDNFNKLSNITSSWITTLEPAPRFNDFLIPAPVFTSRFSWIPPPSDIPIYLMNCVSRT